MLNFGHISFQEVLTISFTLFAVIDMLGSIPVLIAMKEKLGGPIHATQATVVSGILMIIFLFFGEQFLNLLGLDIKSFAVAGSIVIFILGLEMILGIEFFKPEKDPRASGSVVPIAFPIIAGSGTLTTIMSLKAGYYDINILIAILINCVVIYVVLKSLKLLEIVLGPNGLLVIRKFFGVILLAIAVKIFSANVHGLIK
ncbi:MarC family protein [Ferruginibacter albus]|uniref:MarC family protein n=1 Tax=Ferruginibacter albus TaxID=2875540 RepID=UPI001CC70900|nr:MarC family protein [Ferruginibacter albus]UAY52198.1 MarC family protein [Ferruginibacter albus]